MSTPRFTPALALLLLAAPIARAQLSPAEALKSFETADDVRVELVAAEPLIASPCALDFDEKGRLFVAENRGYPNTEKPPQGVIALLEDSDGDGRMDKRVVFAEGLAYPNGVMSWQGGLIVTCAPDVLFLKDTDGDGRADERRVLLTGFDTTKSTQLRVNAPTLGPDGWIYLAAGLAGGTITAPEHPDRAPLKMTADVRFHPETLVVENVDGKSQYGMSFDDFGRRFICMNRLPVQHVVLSSKWLARNPRLAFSETVQDCSERSVKTGLKGGGDGVKLFPISANITTADSHAGSFSAACGVHIWRGGILPARYDGAAFSCDPTGNLIHVDRLEPRGATFSAVPLLSGREFLASRDDYFRPVFLTRGKEGALYVADMYRKTIEHPDYLPEEVRKHTDFETGKLQGRIWRITAREPRKAAAVPAYRDEFAGISKAAADASEAARLAEDNNPRVRFTLALALGDSKADFVVPILAGLAARDVEDRWMRAAVLSGIAGREADFLRALWPKLKGASEGEMELLAGLGRTFSDPTSVLGVLEELKGENAVALAALLGELRGAEKTAAFQKLLEIAASGVVDNATTPAARLLFVRLLARSSWEKAAEPLQQTLSAAGDDALRSAVIRSLATLDGNRAAGVLLAPGRWTGYSPALRETVLSALLARAAKLDGILAAIEAGDLPASALTPQRRQVFAKHTDASIRDRAAKIFAATETNRAASDEKAKAALALAPKAEQGRAVFKQLCATCHRLDREGVAVGPDLLDILKQTKENIVFHIVAPDAEIAPAFTAYTCETKDGRGFVGLLTSETPTSVTIRQPGGAEESVLRGDVKNLSALPGSLMPPGLDAAMTPQNLADLLAFLKGEK
jgi:putative membrane-bound dehydrogenase-like protein